MPDPSCGRHPYPFWDRLYNQLSSNMSIKKFMSRYLVPSVLACSAALRYAVDETMLRAATCEMTRLHASNGRSPHLLIPAKMDASARRWSHHRLARCNHSAADGLQPRCYTGVDSILAGKPDKG